MQHKATDVSTQSVTRQSRLEFLNNRTKLGDQRLQILNGPQDNFIDKRCRESAEYPRVGSPPRQIKNSPTIYDDYLN